MQHFCVRVTVQTPTRSGMQQNVAFSFVSIPRFWGLNLESLGDSLLEFSGDTCPTSRFNDRSSEPERILWPLLAALIYGCLATRGKKWVCIPWTWRWMRIYAWLMHQQCSFIDLECCCNLVWQENTEVLLSFPISISLMMSIITTLQPKIKLWDRIQKASCLWCRPHLEATNGVAASWHRGHRYVLTWLAWIWPLTLLCCPKKIYWRLLRTQCDLVGWVAWTKAGTIHYQSMVHGLFKWVSTATPSTLVIYSCFGDDNGCCRKNKWIQVIVFGWSSLFGHRLYLSRMRRSSCRMARKLWLWKQK